MSITGTAYSHPELHGEKPLTVTVATARKISGLGNTTIWGLIKREKLKSVCVGRRRLIVYSSLEDLLSPELPNNSLKPQRRGRPRKQGSVVSAHDAALPGVAAIQPTATAAQSSPHQASRGDASRSCTRKRGEARVEAITEQT